MSSTLTSAHLISISPYHPSLTSPLLFGSYSALHDPCLTTLPSPPSTTTTTGTTTPTPSEEDDPIEFDLTISSSDLPALLVIESRSHPSATRNAPAWPAYPSDVMSVGSGKDVEEFKKVWEGEVRDAAREEDEK